MFGSFGFTPNLLRSLWTGSMETRLRKGRVSQTESNDCSAQQNNNLHLRACGGDSLAKVSIAVRTWKYYNRGRISHLKGLKVGSFGCGLLVCNLGDLVNYG